MAWTKLKDGLFIGDHASVQVMIRLTRHRLFACSSALLTDGCAAILLTAPLLRCQHHLLVCPFPFAPQDYDLIEPNSITYFLNTAASELDFFWEGVEFLTFHWQDTMDYVVFDEHGIVVEQIVSFIDEGIRKGQSVLVYSTRGLSRSIVCVAAYMMAKYGWGVDKVFEFMGENGDDPPNDTPETIMGIIPKPYPTN